jgi:hypothetical protein
MLKAVRHHTDCPWVLLYIERWLKAPVQMEDGSIVARHAGTCHCRSAEEARALRRSLEARFAACKLALHPQKTQLVYCKDVNRHGDYPNQSFDFLGYRFRPRKSIWHGCLPVVSFLPAVSPKALKAMGQTLRQWRLHHRSDKSLQDLARLHNSHIRGWINYYRHFYGSALHPILHRVDAYLVRWACRKFKRLRRRPRWAQQWLVRVRRTDPDLFAHWRFAYDDGRTSGAV